MPPKTGKKKGKGQSREELERLQREQEEREKLEALARLEREAEERQKVENALRDEAEEKERKRLKKEAQLRLMAEKDATILTLSTELSALQSSFASERSELEEELHRMLQLKESLLNELSVQRTENEEAQRALLDERTHLATELNQERRKNSELTSKLEATQKSLQEAEGKLDTQVGALNRDLAKTKSDSDNALRDAGSRIRNLERELEKMSALNKTIQEVLESREADDRKNVALMQLLNNQLDENKRRSQELLDEERKQTREAKHAQAVAEENVQVLTQEVGILKKEKEQLKKQADTDIHDYKEKLDQLKFDLKYLHSELHTSKTQLQKLQQDTLNSKTEASANIENLQVAFDTEKKKCEELETLMRRKDREHFDKVTFLNAQISNNRAIISQLQQKMAKEREDRLLEVRAANASLEDKANLVHALGDDLEKRKTVAAEVEMKLNADIAILKTTVFQLQSALVEKERDFDVVTASKDEELRRLRRKLDEHFIPHRNEIGSSDPVEAHEASVEAVLNEKLAKLTHDLEINHRVALETETRLKAQIANQTHIIDSLQAELLRVKELNLENLKIQEAENQRLRQLLEVNYIPYAK
jgi:hypothetical protein